MTVHERQTNLLRWIDADLVSRRGNVGRSKGITSGKLEDGSLSISGHRSWWRIP